VSIKQKLVHNFVLTIDCNDDCQTFISHYIISPPISSYFHHNKIQGLTTLKARFQPRSDLSQAWIYLTLVSVMQKKYIILLLQRMAIVNFHISLYRNITYIIIYPLQQNTDNNSLSGSIPAELGSLINLQYLNFRKCDEKHGKHDVDDL
jgi:hypothetical protein